ncbi:CS1 type fimbrial major subunit [Cedecea neteri]|uniref:CS1 type fimbrial major subunit n=1 Tax=Cedecea neteri TaxID=158822 RepID=A0AAN0S6F9_9ENTR|nr:CS1 type fimbrial major subunit [Cedecea neteri]AIR62012.1 CS1 type fimbrial major subunit [Cedecea neteri]
MYAKKMTLLGALLATASSVNAAPQQVDFNVEAVIPATDFFVTPVNGWNAQTQKMAWNAATGSLDGFSQQLQMKNSGGSIKAYLSGQPVLSSASGTDTIDLLVNIAGQTLPIDAASAVTLYSASEAAAEKTATLTVSQKSGTKPTAGTYIGAVTMMFDTETP